MRKLLFFFLLIIYSVTTYGQVYQPLSIDGFNADVIANGTGTALSSTTNDVDGVRYCLKSIDWKQTVASTAQTTGLPLNGIVASIVSLTPGLTYQLQNYSNNNSIRIAYGGTPITSLVTGNVKAKKLFVLATTGENYSNMQCTITFADNTTQEFLTNNVPDWFNGATPPPAFIGFGRVYRSSNVVENPYNNPRLYQIELNIATANQNKEIQSITFGRTGLTNGVLNIFAVSAELALCNAPSLISATPGSICGYGTAELTANYNTGTVRWFANATGGTALHTGNTFTTPVIDTTTSYWINATADLVIASGGRSTHGYDSTVPSQYGLVFTAIAPFKLKTVDVYLASSSASDLVVNLTNSNGTVLQTRTIALPAGGSNSNPLLYTVDLDFDVPIGTGYRLIAVSGPSMIRDTSVGGFPYSLGNFGSITNGFISDPSSTTYYYFYNWQMESGCASPRTEVIATVTPAPPLTLTNTNVVLCAGQSQTVTIASGASNYDSYTITPTTGVTGNATTGWIFNPTVSTVYTLSAKQTTGALCKKDILIDVKVNAVPVINTNVNTVNTCVNEITSITSTTSGVNKNITFGEDTTSTTNTGVPNPLTAWYGGNKTQMLYLASELTAKGFFAGSKIQSLAFDVVAFYANGICNDFRIKIGNTNLSALTSSIQNSANLQTVYNQTFTPTQTGWVTFNFATPFIWDGVSNIIIETAHNSGNWGNGSGTKIRYTATPFVSCTYAIIDNITPPGVSSLDVITFNYSPSSSNRPNVILGTDETLTSIWSPVDHLYTDALATVPYVAGTSTANVYLKANIPVNSQDYTLTTISQNNCSATKTINITVHETPAPTAVDQEFCIAENATIADLVATGTNLKWYDSITSTTALNANVALVNGTSYFVSQTVSNCESERTEVIVTIHNTPAPAAINQTFCIAENATIANLVATGTNLKWYASAISTTALNTNVALVNGTSYFASQTVSNCESERTEVIVNIHNTPAPTAVDQNFCIAENATIADLVATGTDIKWYDSITSTTALNTNVALVNGTSYFASQTVSNCESERTEVIVTIHNTPAPTAINQTFCIAENATVADLVATGTDIKWYDSITSTTALNTNVALVNGTSYFASQTVSNCESERTEVIVNIHNTPAPAAVNQTFCIAENATIADLDAIGTDIKWYDSITSTTALNTNVTLVNGTSYFASQTLNNCESVARVEVIVTIYNTPAPTLNSNQVFCSNTNPKIADLVANGTAIKWYTSATSNTALNTNMPLVNGTSYFASQTLNNCESKIRSEVTIAISTPPNVPNGNSLQTFCGYATIADFVINGDAGAEFIWYQTNYSNTALLTSTTLTNATYYVAQKVGACISDRKPVTARIINLSPPNVSTFEFCGSATVADLYIPTPTGVTYKWYNSPSNPNELQPYIALTTGTYFVSKHEYNCETQRTAVSVVIKDLPDSPTGVSPQTFIEGSVLNQIIVHPSTAVFYITKEDARTGTNPLSQNMPLVNGTIYYAVVIGTNGCPSLPLPITVDVYLSNNEFEKDKLKYYPNPVNEKLHIEYFENIIQVDVFDLTGRHVKSINTNDRKVEIDLSELNTANYIIQLQTEFKQQFIKIIKK